MRSPFAATLHISHQFDLANDLLLQIYTFTMGYEDSVYLAKLAEQAERYEGKLVRDKLRKRR